MSKTLPEYDEQLDTRGLFCPEPIMMLHNKVAELTPGQILQVVATDPATSRDVPKFCEFLRHELVVQTMAADEYYYYIRVCA